MKSNNIKFISFFFPTQDCHVVTSSLNIKLRQIHYKNKGEEKESAPVAHKIKCLVVAKQWHNLVGRK